MKPLISLLLVFGLYLDGRAQIVDLDDNYLEFPCIYADEFYDIRSNQPLTNKDHNLVSNIDRQLYNINLYPEDCYVFRMPGESIISFRLTNGRERTYVVKESNIIFIDESFGKNYNVIYDKRPIKTNLNLNKNKN